MLRRGLTRVGIGLTLGFGYDRIIADGVWGMRKYSYADRLWSTSVAAMGKLSFFDDGLGTPNQLMVVDEYREEILENRVEELIGKCQNSIIMKSKKYDGDFILIEGEFDSHLDLEEELWPKQCRRGYFELVLPKSGVVNGMVIQTAGTGDHGFKRRREIIAKPLINEYGIGSCIMENPFYGRRKPDKQEYSGLRCFLDIITLSMGIAIECNALAKYIKTELKIDRVGFTGLSLGGHTAALSAAVAPTPTPAIAGWAWSTSACVWTKGALSNRINWEKLDKDVKAHPGYEAVFDYFDSGLSKWLSRDKTLQETSLPELTDITFEDSDKHSKIKSKFVVLANHFSHLGNYPVPKDPSLVHYVVGDSDYFFSINDMTGMDRVWPGCTYEVVNSGHVDGFLLHGKTYRKAINDVFHRLPEPTSNSPEVFGNVPLDEIEDGRGTDFIQKTFQYITVQTVNFLQSQTKS